MGYHLDHTLTFSSIIFPGTESETSSLLLAESVRSFGGVFANHPIWFCMPDTGKPLSDHANRRLKELDVRIIPFPFDSASNDIFFAEQLTGLEIMERLSEKQTEFLVWMDANTLLLNEPKELILPQEKTFGYRPVHHLLLGSRFDEPLDAFWTQLYQDCQVPLERVFPMRPVVEDLKMRPYINAGFMIIRPQRNLVRQWWETFTNLSRSPIYSAFYQRDHRYSIFMHQAVLTGVVLRQLELQEMLELPRTYNYPMHLYDHDHTLHRPPTLDELITLRHEGFYTDPGWKEKVPLGGELKKWLENKLYGMRGGR